METEEIVLRLSRLKEKERLVLIEFCEGLKYIDIGVKLGYREGTIKTHMSNIFSKLELAEFKRSERRRVLLEEFCPILNSGNLESPLPEAILELESEPVKPLSEGEEEIIDDLQTDLMVIEPTTIDYIHPPRENRFRGLRLFSCAFFSIIFAIALIFVGIYFGRDLFFNDDTEPTIPVETLVAQALTAASEAESTEPIQSSFTGVPTDTELPLSTNTSPPPTATFLPTNTSTPIPSIQLPFSDDFDDGLSSDWTVLNGTWFTANGKLTTQANDGDWVWLALDEPGWKNYRIKVSVFISSYGSAYQSHVAIAVRTQKSQSKFIAFYSDFLVRGIWGLVGIDNHDIDVISGSDDMFSIPTESNWEIEVNGNAFITYINGREYHRITISGYEFGGIALGVNCDYDKECPKFDNFSIEPLP